MVVSNNVNNQHSPVVIVAAITSKVGRRYPQNVLLPAGAPLRLESLILGNQLITIAKDRLEAFRASLDADQLKELEQALRVSLSL